MNGTMVKHPWRNAIERAGPWLLLAAFLAWGWRRQDLWRSLPVYGDALEAMWALSWFDEALRSGQNLALFPQAFYPHGWQVATLGGGPAMLFALLPLHWLGGPAFALNLAVLLTFGLGYAGAFQLARQFLDRLPAAVAALLITFWGFRWFQTIGHLNVLLGSALLPWMLWLLERALRPDGPVARPRLRLALVGVLWAVSLSGTLYFAWIHGLALLVWVAGRRFGRVIAGRAALEALAIPALTALALSAPLILWTMQAAAAVGAGFFTIEEVNFWGASLNALPIPSLDHPLLAPWSRRIYRGLTFEQGMVNLGTIASLLALAGLWAARRDWRRWLPVVLLAGSGLILALGLTLKWDNQSLAVPALRPLNSALWSVGHWLKPATFSTAQPPPPFDQAVPLPGLWLAAVTPWLERARVFARYALVGAVGVFLLSGLGLASLRPAWVRLAVLGLLLFELLPPPLANLPFPAQPHPALVWLNEQAPPAAGQSVIDLEAVRPHTPGLRIGGEVVWATREHGWPTVSGASSVWPVAAGALNLWLTTHEYAFLSPQIASLLRDPFGVRYLLLHMRGEGEAGLLADAQQSPAFRLVQCFPPPAGPGPWPDPICVLELLPPVRAEINVALEEGWSGEESWGVWMQDTEASAFWIAAENEAQRLHVAAFPLCVAGQPQAVALEVNGVAVAEHRWAGCEPWQTTIDLPTSLVRLGRNDLRLHSAFAGSAGDGDPRLLSVGFTQLLVEGTGP